MATFEINDAVHKSISFSDREKAVIDHPYLQRLRSIRQLGFVPLVYPSATHDRFSHALGTMHVAGLLACQFFYNDSYSAIARVLNEKEHEFLLRIIRLAGLLHDVGHAPFSHPAEAVMPQIHKLDIPRSWLVNPEEKRSASHEDYSVLLLAGMARGKDAVIEPGEAEIISSLIHHKKIKIPTSWAKHFSRRVDPQNLHLLARSLVSSNIDADRLDYLLRDSHFAGVSYGKYDLPWLISNLGVIEHKGEYLMGISDSGIHALEHYLFARYHMYVQVYLHKTVKCFEHYFHQALRERETTYVLPPEREAYVALRDSTLSEHILDASRKNPKSWSARLINRVPSRRIARIWKDRGEIEKMFVSMQGEFEKIGVHPFMVFSQTKFLDVPDAKKESRGKGQGALLFGLAAIPMVVIRKQFGVVSAASLDDSSFILKHYHHDISIGDIYILPEEYQGNEKAIIAIARKYRTFGPSEIELREEL